MLFLLQKILKYNNYLRYSAMQYFYFTTISKVSF